MLFWFWGVINGLKSLLGLLSFSKTDKRKGLLSFDLLVNTMSSSEKELEEQLKEAGNGLLNPPSAIDELIKLLDEANGLLANVGQGPPKSMENALLPLMKALISDELLRHSDVDVKLSVASCISEITRITAPVEPYDDERMKEIFQLTVEAFEKLSHVSSRHYTKAVSILHIVAKVRSSLLMLDLGCKALVLEMFQHFLKINQSNLPHAVFSAMETIMTMVLDESEEIPLDLLKTLLSSVRKENQTVSTISWKLGEIVIENCSAKLKPYLVEAVKSKDIALEGYAPIVASVCQNGSDAPKLDNDNDSGKTPENEKELVKRTLNEASGSQVTEGLTPTIVCPREADKTVAAPTRDEHNVRHIHSSKKLRHCHLTKRSKGINPRDSAKPDNSFSLKAVKSEIESYSAPKKRCRNPNSLKNLEKRYDNAEPDNSFSLKVVKSETEPCSAPKKRGRKPNSLMNPAEGYDHSWISSGRKIQKPAGRRKSESKVSNSSPNDDRLGAKGVLQLIVHSVTEPSSSEPKTEGNIGTSSLLLQNSPFGGTKCRRGRPKKQAEVGSTPTNPSSLPSVRREFSSAQFEKRTQPEEDSLGVKESKETITLEAKEGGLCRGNKLAEKAAEECVSASVHVVTDKECAVPCDPHEKLQQQSTFKVRSGRTNDQSSVRRGTKACKGNATSGKESTEKSGSKRIFPSVTKMSEDNEGTHKVILKRNCTIEKEQAYQMPDLDERLVGSRIKVWWPMDKRFYEGVVSSFDPAKKKHVVVYADGDEENLNLKRQRWNLIDDVVLDVQIENMPKTDASSVIPQKRKRKTKSEPSKQENAGLSSKRISTRGVSAGISIVECMKSGSKSADEDEDGQSKENVILKVDGQISAGKLEADTKNGTDSAQITPVTTTLSKVESAKVDSETSGRECAKELIELSKGDDEAGQSKENDRLKVDGQVSAGKLEADTKKGINSVQITPETTTLSKVESAKVDSEPSGRECAKELIELSKGEKNAVSPFLIRARRGHV